MIFALRNGNASRGELDRSAVGIVTCRSFLTRLIAPIVVYRHTMRDTASHTARGIKRTSAPSENAPPSQGCGIFRSHI